MSQVHLCHLLVFVEVMTTRLSPYYQILITSFQSSIFRLHHGVVLSGLTLHSKPVRQRETTPAQLGSSKLHQTQSRQGTQVFHLNPQLLALAAGLESKETIAKPLSGLHTRTHTIRCTKESPVDMVFILLPLFTK